MINWAAMMPDNQSPPSTEPEKAPETTRIAAVAARPQNLCAQNKAVVAPVYPAHPAAVLLAMAWTRAKGSGAAELAAMLGDLASKAPADQVRHWYELCKLEGIKPWRVLFLPAPTWGDDCTRCRHLNTVEDIIGEGRRRYHWACSKGYLILEQGRGTERVHVAPPECQSFERWFPSEMR